jgi:tRNA G46 methylase TrmB
MENKPEQLSLTRWQKFYLDDPELGSIPTSLCAQQAVEIFAQRKTRLILDLGCGTGRNRHTGQTGLR